MKTQYIQLYLNNSDNTIQTVPYYPELCNYNKLISANNHNLSLFRFDTCKFLKLINSIIFEQKNLLLTAINFCDPEYELKNFISAIIDRHNKDIITNNDFYNKLSSILLEDEVEIQNIQFTKPNTIPELQTPKHLIFQQNGIIIFPLNNTQQQVENIIKEINLT